MERRGDAATSKRAKRLCRNDVLLIAFYSDAARFQLSLISEAHHSRYLRPRLSRNDCRTKKKAAPHVSGGAAALRVA